MGKKKQQGWRPRGSVRRIEPDPEKWPSLAADDADAGLWAEVRDDLTFGQLDAIPFGTSVKWAEMWDAIAPHVVAWNVEGQEVETGEWSTIPAPADAGPDVFGSAPKQVTVWIATELKFGPLRGLDPKDKSTSADTGATTSAKS